MPPTADMMDDEPLTSSYEFYDDKRTILLTLFAHGRLQQKDLEILVDTDKIKVKTPLDEGWEFQLYDHVFPDELEVDLNWNKCQTQTSIEIRLPKQKPNVTWTQINSLNSVPIVPTDDKSMWHDCQDVTMTEENFVPIPLKKFSTNFYETNEKFTTTIYVKQVHNCRVQFSETNFTMSFQTNDPNFLNQHSLRSDQTIRVVVRVNERIVPERCSFSTTPTIIEIVLAKEKPSSIKWNRLEAFEHSEHISPHKPINTPATPPPSPKVIPLPPPPPPPIIVNRKSDKLPSASDFNAAIEQKEAKGYSSLSSGTVALGFTGINNPANSCFMNAAIQCLSNTRELRDYFLQRFYALEINQNNPLGMKGLMAEAFAALIKDLWSGKSSWANGNGIRTLVAKRHQEFVGHGQHDAQELLTILLDAIHEDLNRILSKPQVPPVEDQGRADSVVADEFWRGYLSRNDSIIVQLFTGQFKSKTKCPQCHKESVTFDPFTSLSVPLPKRTAVDVIVLYRTDEKAAIKYRIVLPSDGSIFELKRHLSRKCSLTPNQMIAYKVRGNRILDILKDDERATTTSTYSLNSADVIFIAETLTSGECRNEPIIHLTFFQRIFKVNEFVSKCGYCQAPANPHKASVNCPNCYQTFYCDDTCLKLHSSEHKKYCGLRSAENYENIGIPFLLSLPESKFTSEYLFQQLTIHAKRSVEIHPDNRTPTSTDDEDSFSDVENLDWPTMKETLSSSDSWSICRLGDYFVKQRSRNKRRHPPSDRTRKEKSLKSSQTNGLTNGDETSDDALTHRRLFRLMPHLSSQTQQNLQPIIEPGEEADRILRRYRMFSLDWFTDNKPEAPLRIIPSKNRHGINDLIEDKSVTEMSSGDQEITLQQCLQMFIEPEILGPDDKWYCPHCKEHMQAEKKMSVWRLPPILIIQLKRFKYYHGSSAFGYLSDSRVKIDTNVKFPVYNLDMAPYCSSTSDSSQSRYDLFGVINHRGSAWFGHYTSCARLLAYNDPAKTEIAWRNFDDEYVTTLSNEKELNRPDAYVLFYRHRHLPVHFNLPDPPVSQSLPITTPMEISDDLQTMETTALDDINALMN